MSKDRRRERAGRTALPVQGKSFFRSKAKFLWLLGIGVAGVGIFLYVAVIRGGLDFRQSSPNITGGTDPQASFVGARACAGCHETEYEAWRGSHHAMAMQPANEKTVLGNFASARFNYAGVTSVFFKRDGRFVVRTDGPDGRLTDYEIKYAFGIDPLQQYLIEFPGGRLQALSIAWDSRPREEGGQRWFHLYPNDRITHGDELHWTGRSQNWNFMCAECHSTNLQKNYDPAKRAYQTTWSDVNVACEACHGPGSRHVAWAQQKGWWQIGDDPVKGLLVALDERKNVRWSIDPQTGNARRSVARASATEIQLCARCHSRRAQLFGDYRYGQPLMQSHLPSLLVAGLYHADGQIDGEVYEYGSFLQSKMYQAGVTCSDCHEPHGGELRAKGNSMCATCHLANKYDTEAHSHHRPTSAGAACVACHMPTKTYMVVDARRDHSFRIPRPDLSAKLGTPNACGGCHRDKTTQWAADKAREWYGSEPKGYQRYAETLSAARVGVADAESRLIALSRDHGQPAIARATAVEALGRSLSQQSFQIVVDALKDPDPMVRGAAVEALEQVSPAQRWPLAAALLRDPVRAVRMLAAGLLAGVRGENLSPVEREELQKANDEYLAAQRHNADDPAAQVNLGNFYAARGESQKAEAAYREALAIDPRWVPAYVNLADLMRQLNRDADGVIILRAAIALEPNAAALFYSLGLAQVRQKNLPAALVSLKRAAELAPKDPRYNYVYAVALHDAGKKREALAQVDAALRRIDGDRSLKELRNQLSGTGNARSK